MPQDTKEKKPAGAKSADKAGKQGGRARTAAPKEGRTTVQATPAAKTKTPSAPAPARAKKPQPVAPAKGETPQAKGGAKPAPRPPRQGAGRTDHAASRSLRKVSQETPSVSATLQVAGKKRLVSGATAHPARATLRVIPLGGMCEIGKNMTAYEYGNDIIIVDVGQSFPDESMPGVDAVIPDFTYVLQNADRVRGIFLTHGHEDHIGGMPYLLKQMQAPVYGGPLTIELMKYKLEDRMPGLLKRSKLHVVRDGEKIQCGCFQVEFIHVNHSIADASMFAIKTPLGYVVHSGDFKVDYTPIDGGIIDLQRIAEIGHAGVLLYVCESTNVEKKGHTVSERTVGDSFSAMFDGAKGRIFVATFSSNIYRLQQVFTAAEQHGRKVALVGRSMLNVFNAANSLGYIQMKKDTLIDINRIDDYPPDRVVIISTGSQGEPMSALTRIAFASHRSVEMMRGDTVIISATPIPGNEKPVFKVINELYRRGAKVYYSALADVHASGHAAQEELKLVLSLVKPQYLIPAHGEYRMLYQHAEMAHALGMPWENLFVLNNGDIFEVSHKEAKITGFTNGAAVLIDGEALGDVDNAVLRERKLLSDDGVVAVSIVLNKRTEELAAPPVVGAMGFLYSDEYDKITAECERRAVAFVLRAKSQNRKVAEAITSGQMRDQLRNFLYEKTHRRPVVLVQLTQV